METRREIILATVVGLASSFIYYDRKEDEYLPVGDIEKALQKGEVTAEEILDTFSQEAGLDS